MLKFFEWNKRTTRYQKESQRHLPGCSSALQKRNIQELGGNKIPD